MMIDARARSVFAPAAVVETRPDDRDATGTLHHQHRGRPRHQSIDAAVRAMVDNNFVLSAMSSRKWRVVYRAAGVLQKELRKRRNVRAALKKRFERSGSTEGRHE